MSSSLQDCRWDNGGFSIIAHGLVSRALHYFRHAYFASLSTLSLHVFRHLHDELQSFVQSPKKRRDIGAPCVGRRDPRGGILRDEPRALRTQRRRATRRQLARAAARHRAAGAHARAHTLLHEGIIYLYVRVSHTDCAHCTIGKCAGA
eukprot:4323998-Pleurochrysis_carterae.AAC.8